MDSTDLTSVVAAVLRHAPHWIRTDLQSKDAQMRACAEDALAAMVAAALVDAPGLIHIVPRQH